MADDATFHPYFDQVRRHPLLSEEQERALCRTIQEGQIDARCALLALPLSTEGLLELASTRAHPGAAREDHGLDDAALRRLDDVRRRMRVVLRELDRLQTGEGDPAPSGRGACVPDQGRLDDLRERLYRLDQQVALPEQAYLTIAQSIRDPRCGVTLQAPVSAHREALRDAVDRYRTAMARSKRCQDRLVEANLRLVLHYALRLRGRGVPLPDLVQEGNLGLIRAAEKYDLHRTRRFSAYAYWWIRQALLSAVAQQSKTIRVPVRVVTALYQEARVARDLSQCLGRTPSTAEIAAALGQPQVQVEGLLMNARGILYLDAPIDEAGGRPLLDAVEDRGARRPDDAVNEAEVRTRIRGLLESLPERDAALLRRRYGIDEQCAWTLRELGEHRGVCRERVRQIEAQILGALRAVPGLSGFRAAM